MSATPCENATWFTPHLTSGTGKVCSELSNTRVHLRALNKNAADVVCADLMRA